LLVVFVGVEKKLGHPAIQALNSFIDKKTYIDMKKYVLPKLR